MRPQTDARERNYHALWWRFLHYAIFCVFELEEEEEKENKKKKNLIFFRFFYMVLVFEHQQQ